MNLVPSAAAPNFDTKIAGKMSCARVTVRQVCTNVDGIAPLALSGSLGLLFAKHDNYVDLWINRLH